MSDRLADAFDFTGRLSFVGRERLSRKLVALAILPILGPMGLLLLDVPRAFALVPLILLLPLMAALVAADMRRLHDVNQHAHIVYGRSFLGFAVAVGPLLAAALLANISDWARLALAGSSVVLMLAMIIRQFLRPPIEWRRGDPGPNRFGPPPE